jgi:hypothetical protein
MAQILREPNSRANLQFLHMTPQMITTLSESQMMFLGAMKAAGQVAETPLAQLYRIYTYILMDDHEQINFHLEALWQQPWRIRNIPDPLDPEPERYAFLACTAALVCRLFNGKINAGMHRPNAARLGWWKFRRSKFEEAGREKAPAWAERVPPLEETLTICQFDCKYQRITLESFDDFRASPEFAKKNILLTSANIDFMRNLDDP